VKGLESEERFRRLSEAAFEGIVITEGGRITDCNARLAEMFGYRAEQLRGLPARVLIARESHDIVRKRLQEPCDAPYEIVAIRRDGSRFDVELRSRMMPQADRSVRVTAVHDITERKRAERAFQAAELERQQAEADVRALEDQLRHSQKLEAIGQLAGGIAHDFNNLLTVINGYCERLLASVPDGGALREDLDLIHNAGRRAAALTRQLLAFSRRQVLQPRTIELNAIVHDIDKMLRRVIGEPITVVTALAPDLGATRADPGQIEQVIMNLAINARDAMPQGGVLTIETRNVEVGGDAPGAFGLPPGRYVSLLVRDTGHGMDEETLSHMFEPFFTTKELGKGTGLGLPTVYGIVMQSGGDVAVESVEGEGTTMRVFLPRIEAPAEREAAPAAAEPVARGSETLLVVEDEELVRELVREFLESAGYTVIEAPDAEAALLLAEANREAIDLLVTDVILPGMNGLDLAVQLSASMPGLKTVFVSGYPGDAVFRDGTFDPGAAFLPKPFTRHILTQKVREALDRTARAAPSVMVIDEDEDIRRLLGRMLRTAGYAVVEATSPSSPDGARAARLDVVLADVTSNPQSMTALQRLRLAHPETQIVLMAGAFSDRLLRDASGLGVHATLQKPLDEHRVLEAVGQALKGA
jgi:PAS domain S-box-containing protein